MKAFEDIRVKVNEESFFNTSDNAWIYFEDHNKDGDNPIVLLHGFCGSTRFFRGNIKGLTEKGNRLILVDWRGHGASSNTLDNLTMQRSAQDIKELFDFLQIENATLLGWSMGSSVVLDYYEQYKNYRIKAIGVIDSALYPYSNEDWNCHFNKGFNYQKLANTIYAAYSDRIAWTRSFTKLCFPEDYDLSEEELSFFAGEMMQLPPWIAYALYGDFLLRDYTKTLAKLEIPCMIAGAKSPALPIGHEVAEYYASLVNAPHTLKKFDKGGHMLFYVNPSEFNEYVLSFVNDFCKDKS